VPFPIAAVPVSLFEPVRPGPPEPQATARESLGANGANGGSGAVGADRARSGDGTSGRPSASPAGETADGSAAEATPLPFRPEAGPAPIRQ
jgi:hypothetical protein